MAQTLVVKLQALEMGPRLYQVQQRPHGIEWSRSQLLHHRISKRSSPRRLLKSAEGTNWT
jgi:hypothetical protein